MTLHITKMSDLKVIEVVHSSVPIVVCAATGLFLWLKIKAVEDKQNQILEEIDDIKENLIDAFLYEVDSKLSSQLKGLSLSQKVQSLHLIGGPRENPKPLNISLLFFNEDPEKFFPYSRIEIVEKPDPTGEGMTERTITGPLDWQIRSALQYLNNSVIAEKVFKLPGQAEALRFYNYPYAALEEALVNAVYHKSYQIHEPITVTILPDRIEKRFNRFHFHVSLTAADPQSRAILLNFIVQRYQELPGPADLRFAIDVDPINNP